jgi:hypothetical protein
VTRFEFPTNVEAAEYCERILESMRQLFGIDEDDALARINRHWRGQTMTSDDDLRALTHELPDYWARLIYYGPDVKWWIAGTVLQPRELEQADG